MKWMDMLKFVIDLLGVQLMEGLHYRLNLMWYVDSLDFLIKQVFFTLEVSLVDHRLILQLLLHS